MNIVVGRCYPRETLVEFMKLCQKYQIHLISDEIYALSVWKNEEAPNADTFVSILSLDPAGVIDPSLVHVMWGMSKVSVPLKLASDLNAHVPLGFWRQRLENWMPTKSAQRRDTEGSEAIFVRSPSNTSLKHGI